MHNAIAAGDIIVSAAYGGNADAAQAEARAVLADGEQAGLLKRWTMPELMAEPTNFDWLVRGLLADSGYGQTAGEMKSLKSTILDIIMVGLAAGVPIFDTFAPKGPRPVVAYIGEGGRIPSTRRLRRVCSAMGVKPTELDLHPIFDVAPISSPEFQGSLPA